MQLEELLMQRPKHTSKYITIKMVNLSGLVVIGEAQLEMNCKGDAILILGTGVEELLPQSHLFFAVLHWGCKLFCHFMMGYQNI